MNVLREYRPDNRLLLKSTPDEKTSEEEDVVVEISVKKIKSPSSFGAQIIRGRESDKNFQKLKEDIQHYFNDPTFSRMRVLNPTEGQRCVVKTDDRTWHRAVINKVYVSGKQGFIIYCNLVDDVEYSSVPASCVYETPSWVWQHPIQSACFGLYGIAPTRLRADYAEERMDLVASKNPSRWDQASCRFFEDLCSASRSFKAHLVESDERNVFWVRLFSMPDENGNSFCVNDELLKQHYAMIVSIDKNNNLNSAGESEESGSEGKYLSPMQYKARHDMLSQLWKENVKSPSLLSDSDDSDLEDLKSEASSCKQKRANDTLSEPRQAPHKVCGQNMEDDSLNEHFTNESGDFGAEKTEEKHDGTSRNMDIDRKLIPVEFGEVSHNQRPTNGLKEIAAWEQTLNRKGVLVRSVSLQTGMDVVDDVPEREDDGPKDFCMQVDFDDASAMPDFDQTPPIPVSKKVFIPFKEANIDVTDNGKVAALHDAKLTKLPPLDEGAKVPVTESLSYCAKWTTQGKTQPLCRTYSTAPDKMNNELTLCSLKKAMKIDISQTPQLRPSTNEFFRNAPRSSPTLEEKNNDESSSSDVSSGDEILKKPVMEKAQVIPPLKTVFVPDNLHSGSVILIRGQNPPHPIALFCKSPFSLDMQRLLEVDLRYKGPRLIQAHTWPAILAHRDILAIAPRCGGKTLAYTAPIAHLVIRDKAETESKQPIAIVVTPDWTDAQRLHELFEAFFADCDTEHKVIAVYGGTPAENLKASEIASGCSVLICTAPSLIRICKAKYANFNRLKYLVLDNVNVLVEEFTDEMKELMVMQTNALATAAAMLKPKKPPQLICMGSQWTEGVKSFANRFVRCRPLLLISHPLEAAVYGNVQHQVMPCHPGELTEVVKEILYLWDETKEGGIAIFVKTPKDVSDMQEMVESMGFYAIKAHNEMSQWEIEEVRRQFDDDTSKPVLVATDDVVLELDIYTMQIVVHYSFPANQHRLGVRLSTMQTCFQNKPEGDSPTYARSFFLITTHDSPHAPDLVSFLQRLGQPVSPELKALANIAIKTHETAKSSIPLCRMIKSFGQCRDEQICLYRHQLSPLDQPNRDARYARIPTSGHVRVQVTHVEDATHYYVRLLAVKNESGEIFKYDANHAKLMMDLAMHFSLLSEDGLSNDPEPGVIYSLKRSYDRALVLRITKPDTLSKKDLEEWTIARKQTSNMNSFICWTTPGGARKTCIRLVDTGSIRVVRCDDLMEIPEKFSSVPFQAVEARVCGVRPIDKDTKWLAQTNDFVHQNLFNKEIEGNIVAALDHTIWLQPAVVREKLPLTNCTVTEFNVALQLLGRYANKNTEQVNLIKNFVSGKSSDNAKVVTSGGKLKTPRFPTEPVQPKCKTKIFASSKAIEKSNHAKGDAWLEALSETETEGAARQPRRKYSTSSDTSTLSSQSSTNYHPKVLPPVLAPAPSDAARKLPPPRRLEPLPSSVAAKLGEHQPRMNREILEDLTKGRPRNNVISNDLLKTKLKVQEKLSVKNASTNTLNQLSDPDNNNDPLHLLGSLCDRFCVSSGVDRLKLLQEIHVNSVGCSYDLTEKDMKGLSKVFNNAKTTQEMHIITGSLLTVSLDEAPVASFVDLAYVIDLACSVPFNEIAKHERKTRLMENLLRLAQTIIDSLEHNSRVVKNRVPISDLNEMILTVEKYLYLNTGRSKALDEASFVLTMLRDYGRTLRAKQLDEKKNILKKAAVMKIARDSLDYSRFNNIDTDTDTDTIVRPFDKIVCKYESSDTAISDTDTLDIEAHLR